MLRIFPGRMGFQTESPVVQVRTRIRQTDYYANQGKIGQHLITTQRHPIRDASVVLYLIDYQSTFSRSAGIFFSSLKQLKVAQGNALFDMAVSYQVFGYLDRVQCRSFTDLVADTPEGQAVRVGNILADTAHIDRIAAGQQ